jgi:rhodanese-related sulfurtransferase
VNFFSINNYANVWLAALAAVSGVMLLVPILRGNSGKVSILEATQLFNQGKTLFLDIRDEAEFAKGHVREARNIPLKQLKERIGELNKFKAKSVVVICAKCSQSGSAATQLKTAGFENVQIMDGGVAAWQAQGMPVIK